MVLTNFELWAADGSTGSSLPVNFESNNLHTRNLNPFDPRVVPQISSNLNHLSSNGYYGFSYVNAAELNNNNNINNNNNNNSTTLNLMANDVNDIKNTLTTATTQQQTHAMSVDFGSSAYAAGHAVNAARCKKRFAINDDVASACTATNNKNYYTENFEVSAKRCRFDDDFSAQYCNDFFQLPSTQIATQSCLMDTEEGTQKQQQYQHQQQQQVDVAMFENNNNNIAKYEQKLNPQLQTLSAHHHQQHNQQQLQTLQQQEQQQPHQQHLYHQQQHYQGHLHRANRDVSRCMLSHMI